MAKAGRPPGTPKTGGRQPGSPNKVTAELRQWLQGVIDRNKDQFEKDLQNVESAQRMAMIEKLMAYMLPKPQNFSIELEYRHLEALLEKTPDQYIETITAKIFELNAKNTNEDE
jgi:hypothetical protein